ncbi:kinase-like protein [Coprinopsis marcescibilis]|uniref:Kinase-like protein n=1 Tax=Coprinopsis marcescibilis TaxID=230819 RepID=A0A5C3L627_COPMA|nr:kinase-like protein [Coprinopsis marcescibilis]
MADTSWKRVAAAWSSLVGGRHYPSCRSKDQTKQEDAVLDIRDSLETLKSDMSDEQGLNGGPQYVLSSLKFDNRGAPLMPLPTVTPKYASTSTGTTTTPLHRSASESATNDSVNATISKPRRRPPRPVNNVYASLKSETFTPRSKLKFETFQTTKSPLPFRPSPPVRRHSSAESSRSPTPRGSCDYSLGGTTPPPPWPRPLPPYSANASAVINLPSPPPVGTRLANKRSNIDDSESVRANLNLVHLVRVIQGIISQKASYQALLRISPEDAQMVLDLLQTALDKGVLGEEGDRRALLQAMVRISKKMVLLPRCLVLSREDVAREEYPRAAGHFSEVFKGFFLGRAVAMKILKVYQHKDVDRILKVFYRETLIWSQLSHENLLPFYGILQPDGNDGRLCFVSPWMENGNVREYVCEHPEADLLLLMTDVLRGIEYLHSEGIVHSDLKGDNILITPSSRACLADFGLSRITDSKALSWTFTCSTTQQGGTPRWQAPELLDPESESHIEASKESDMYSFGGICYEVLTGKVPFYEYPRDATVCLKVMNGHTPSHPALSASDNITAPRSNSSSVNTDSEAILELVWPIMQTCWLREPAKRPTAAELLARDPFLRVSGNGMPPDSDMRNGDLWWGLELEALQFRSTVHVDEETMEYLTGLLQSTGVCFS